MATVLALYNMPTDTRKFDEYYFSQHIPLAKTLPGLMSYYVSEGPVAALSGQQYHLVAQLTFKSVGDIHSALASPEGKAVADDLANFAQAGVTLLMFDSKLV